MDDVTNDGAEMSKTCPHVRRPINSATASPSLATYNRWLNYEIIL